MKSTRYIATALALAAAIAAADEKLTYSPRQVLKQPIRPITEPKIVSASDADIQDNELVIGLQLDGQARAWSINQLTGPRREIINDEMAGTAIAATW